MNILCSDICQKTIFSKIRTVKFYPRIFLYQMEPTVFIVFQIVSTTAHADFQIYMEYKYHSDIPKFGFGTFSEVMH